METDRLIDKLGEKAMWQANWNEKWQATWQADSNEYWQAKWQADL